MNESLYRCKFAAGEALACAKAGVPLGDEIDILREQFRVACERAEAWKALAIPDQINGEVPYDDGTET